MSLAPEDIAAIAAKVVELLAEAKELPPAGLVDAATLASALGTSRAYVYANADRLGAVRLGDGPKGRLRFDVAKAKAAQTGTIVPPRDVPEAPAPDPHPRRRSRRPSTVDLLPIGRRT